MASVNMWSPIAWKSFLVLSTLIIFAVMSLSATIGFRVILAHKPMNGKAEKNPFCNENGRKSLKNGNITGKETIVWAVV